MKKIYKHLIVVLLFAFSLSASSQQLLHNSYRDIKDESVKYNSEVLAIYYQETPISLTVAKSNDLIDYVKIFTFNDLKCISETHCYPSDLFGGKLILLTALYGDAAETKYGNNTMYVWRKDGMRITLTLNYTTMHKKNITQINYAYDSDTDFIVDVSQKSQSAFVKAVVLKTE